MKKLNLICCIYCLILLSSCSLFESENRELENLVREVNINNSPSLSLHGEWDVCLDSCDFFCSEIPDVRFFDKQITLPGTLAEANIGFENKLLPSTQKPQILHLTPRFSYVAPAFYQRKIEIPSSWEKQQIQLSLERVLWSSKVWVDGCLIPEEKRSLSGPHRYDLSDYLTPGEHTLTLRIDNRKLYDISVNDMAHAYTNETQTMWNGVLGEISLTPYSNIGIERVEVTPYPKRDKISFDIHLLSDQKIEANNELKIFITEKNKGGVLFCCSLLASKLNQNESGVNLSFDTKDLFVKWSEFSPQLYTVHTFIKNEGGIAYNATDFGYRDIKIAGRELLINDRPVFLRGTLECCIFPLQGYPPMEKDGWSTVFKTASNWGLNHLRFHSWCPPKAAFEVADSMGFYLQVELPLWSLNVGKTDSVNTFLEAEAQYILQNYGNHPSFCLLSIGNELQPDFNYLNTLVKSLKAQDRRHLYTASSFTFEKGHGGAPEEYDDFFVTQWTNNGWVRGQGVFDKEAPSFNKEYDSAMKDINIPLITHEIGQYAVYPNLKEIDKYTGVLDPLNFKGIQLDLREKGLESLADSFMLASGKLAYILYKEEIERALKTKGISGFQLLDLHDFPGQGTALVGLLDAFWDNKGIVEDSLFRQFCSPVVPLVHFDKATYWANEPMELLCDLKNYSNLDVSTKDLRITIVGTDNELSLDSRSAKEDENGRIKFVVQAPNVAKASKFIMTAYVNGTDYKNSWDIWIYPQKEKVISESVLYTRTLKTAKEALRRGEIVLFNPEYDQIKGLEGKFVPVFWSPVHFPNQAGSMGILCDPDHPAFEDFPTDYYSNWQWWSLLKQSRTVVMDSIRQITPIVRVIDNFSNNRRLGTLFEANVENGKLIFCSMDLVSDINSRPEACQLYNSLIHYMESKAFNPVDILSINELENLLY